jgi:hypothetical protein
MLQDLTKKQQEDVRNMREKTSRRNATKQKKVAAFDEQRSKSPTLFPNENVLVDDGKLTRDPMASYKKTIERTKVTIRRVGEKK